MSLTGGPSRLYQDSKPDRGQFGDFMSPPSPSPSQEAGDRRQETGGRRQEAGGIGIGLRLFRDS